MSRKETVTLDLENVRPLPPRRENDQFDSLLGRKLSKLYHPQVVHNKVLRMDLVVTLVFTVVTTMILTLTISSLWACSSAVVGQSVTIPLACEAKNLRYTEREVPSRNRTCSEHTFYEKPTLVEAKLCGNHEGTKKACYSQLVNYQRKRHILEVLYKDVGGRTIVNEASFNCTDVVRKYWYTCDNLQSAGNEYMKLEIVHDNVVMTVFKVQLPGK